jgi:hypothetical protein
MLESIAPMKPRFRVAEARTPGGELLELYERDGGHDIVVERRPLMSSRKHQSEEDLASMVCHDLSAGARVLIGASAWASRCAPHSTSFRPMPRSSRSN